MTERLAIVSSACRFPDASSLAELWENSVCGRRSFRAIPPSRLDLAGYAEHVVGIADSIVPVQAGLLTGWCFDRGRFKIPKRTFESTDLVHWLALELAAEALDGIGGVEGLDRRRTAVVVANTLTGEFSRATLLRLRGPFLDELLGSVVDDVGVGADSAALIRSRFSAALRERLPEPTEDSLAGGLANTIAGRIANYFDFGGGAYSVDGACASSLVALADAASLLTTGQADTVVVGAVDLSLDPFELVGFSRNGALARDDMRVFDARSNGFWPGEGGAFIVLVTEKVARRLGLEVQAWLRGWGLSSDGAGGLTRPSSAGQLQAYRRAYERAGVDPADLAFVEAHGTGTAVGDPTEVRALAELRAGAGKSLPIGSIKANVGHTKAAAGFAGLLRALGALNHRLVPPHVGCFEPHPVFKETDALVRPALLPEPIVGPSPALAGVSSFGFGGINTHVVLEGNSDRPPAIVIQRPVVPQDVELFLLSAPDAPAMERQLEVIEARASALSLAELSDFAASVSRQAGRFPLRVALVARSGEELCRKARLARAVLASGSPHLDHDEGVFVASSPRPRRVGYLFPGQAAPVRPGGGIWPRRFSAMSEPFVAGPVPSSTDAVETAVAQPTLVAASLSGEALLRRLGVHAVVGVGHSLGEIAALAWSGVMSPGAALDVARARGRIMSERGLRGGAMLRLRASREHSLQLIRGTPCVLACENGPAEFVISGTELDIAQLAKKSARSDFEALRLSVSHAFHSPHMQPAAGHFEEYLAGLQWDEPRSMVYSTVTGEALRDRASIAPLLIRQLTSPVLFDAALTAAANQADLFIEVGAGQVLTRLAREKGLEAYSVDAHGYSLAPLMRAAAALFVAGHDIDARPLSAAPIPGDVGPASTLAFLANPCGGLGLKLPAMPLSDHAEAPSAGDDVDPPGSADSSIDAVISALSSEIGLPADAIGKDDRFLDDLHLNSLAVSRIVAAAARASMTRMPRGPTDFANATPRELAAALDEIRGLGGQAEAASDRLVGVRPWVRTYGVRWSAEPFPDRGACPCKEADDSTVIIVPQDMAAEHSAWLLAEVQRAIADGKKHLSILHAGAPLSAFARSVFYEGYFDSLTVIERPADVDSDLAALLAGTTAGYQEYRVDAAGGLHVPEFVVLEPRRVAVRAIDSSDVVLVTGGARGIGAECALRLGQKGATLVLVGRSEATDRAVVATLERAGQLSISCHYASADVADAGSLWVALAPILDKVGRPTVLLHAAGVNEPGRVAKMDRVALERAMHPKVSALANLLALLGDRLERVITFGSIIGRLGLEGEAHYALANAQQSLLTENVARAHPACATLAIEWSVWGGIGMGERLGTIDRLEEKGVDALSVDDALEAFDRLVEIGASGSVAVTGRFGPPPYLGLGQDVDSTHRFIDDVKLFYPGVEAVVDAHLHRGRDRYLEDHVINGETIMPGVMTLEAMAQVASLLSREGTRLVAAHDVNFHHAIIIPDGGSLTIRISALRDGSGRTDVILTSSADDFSKSLASASFATEGDDIGRWQGSGRQSEDIEATSMYRFLLFQGPRFQRLSRWRLLTSREIVAEFASAAQADWFGSFDDQRTIFLDPAIADATLHALQPAIPHKRAVPVHIRKISLSAGPNIPAVVRARELSANGDRYVFDIVLEDATGAPVQEWAGVTFASLGEVDCMPALEAIGALSVPYLERLARESLDDSLEVTIVRDTEAASHERKRSCINRLGTQSILIDGPDGRPAWIDGTEAPSFSHWQSMTLAVMAKGRVGCDIEGAKAGTSFVTAEVVRKLGRRVSPSSLQRFDHGEQVKGANMRTLVVSLPTPEGPAIVGVGIRAPTSQLGQDT